jgi:uncharacterized membrane protein (DUF373 family)
MKEQAETMHPVRAKVLAALGLVEDVIYSGLGILLAIFAFALLLRGFRGFWLFIVERGSVAQFVDLLDEVLVILLVVELLYTVQVSFRERGLVTEPFLVVALISVIRRVLVLIAQVPQLAEASEVSFHHAVWELILLTVMIVVLVGALILLQRQAKAVGTMTEAAPR